MELPASIHTHRRRQVHGQSFAWTPVYLSAGIRIAGTNWGITSTTVNYRDDCHRMPGVLIVIKCHVSGLNVSRTVALGDSRGRGVFIT